MSRRDFLELAAAGTAGVLLAQPASAATYELPAADLARWRKDLLAPALPRLYRSDRHTDARMHLGGIGTGNFELGADGQFTTWQLFNTLRDGHVPLHFAIKSGSTARLLQTAGGPDWPRVNQIEMSADYPVARLRFIDPGSPLEVGLEAFSPFAPLDTSLSSMPLGVFVFRIRNTSSQAQTVSLAAFMQNPVGYDARGDNAWASLRHPNFGGNVNEPLQEGQAHGLLFRALPGGKPVLDQDVLILAGANLKGLKTEPTSTPANLHVEIADSLPLKTDRKGLPGPARTVIWLEDAPADLSADYLKAIGNLVSEGATLVFSGRNQPLLRTYAAVTGGKPLSQASQRQDILFDDFERGYENWTIEGDAFGTQPARGTLANQQRVSGFLGKGLVNTFLNGDDTTGRLVSKPFKIERHFIRFLIGGGRHATTQIRLVAGGKVVRTLAGKDNERLEPAVWDVQEFEGLTGHLEIVDHQKGPWGHVNVDQISFSDQAGDWKVLAQLDEMVPARFRSLQTLTTQPGQPPQVRFEGLDLRADAQEKNANNGLKLLLRRWGKGQVAVVAGEILNPAHAEYANSRPAAYAFLCELVGAKFEAAPGQHDKAPGFGTLALAATAGDKTVLTAFDDWAEAWKQFSAEGRFGNFEAAKANPPTPTGSTIAGAVATTLTVPPGLTVEIPFLLAWHYPNKYSGGGSWMGCHYATQSADAREVLRTATSKLDEWRSRTLRFRDALYDSTLPWWLLDCLTANAAILRHIGVVFRIANGDTYGWEGSNGCCQPTCTHVWGYEQTLARLFPELERGMRRIDFKHQQRKDGGVNNRTDVPSPPRPTGEQPFADGHASCILKAYREALNSPDEAFFAEYWPHIKPAVNYLVGRDVRSHGGQPAGYLEDDQWNTYDEALHGVTTFISGYYLAALRAGEEWARRMGDQASADRWHEIFAQGRDNLVKLCWNGEYFQQHLPDYEKRPGEVGPGCMADQLIGQWWAHQLGLGYLLPREMVVTALRHVFKYNFKSDLTGWKHMPRAFAGANDKGLIICTWPKGGRPGHVMLYSDEVWTGIEYQVAAHMIYEGLVEDGLAIVKAARDRYDGVPRPPIQRNPWNEIECGGHYARAMSSWSLLLAASGWEYDGPRKALRLTPRCEPGNLKCFWTAPAGWGTLSQKINGRTLQAELMTAAGRLPLQSLDLALPEGWQTAQATVTSAGKPLKFTLKTAGARCLLTLTDAPILNEGERLTVALTG